MGRKTKIPFPQEDESDEDSIASLSPVDSEDGAHESSQSEEESASDESEEFEDQGSSDDDEERLENQINEDESDDEIMLKYENQPRKFDSSKRSRNNDEAAKYIHTDDWSSDEEDGDGNENRIGRVPLHWYEDQDHIGYNAHGSRVMKSASSQGDLIDQRLANQDNAAAGKYVVHDALNDKNVELSARQLELIRRVQAGAYAHPEFEGEPDYVDYYSSIPETSGINSNKYEPKARFQPSRWEKMQIDRLVDRLQKGEITRDFLLGKEKRNHQQEGPFMLWKGDEEDELANRKGPQHIAAPKLPPPGHALSYIPPDEYLPTEEEVEQWKEMEPKNRPHGLFIPKKFPNLRSVGAYKHSVQEVFERCLDLYLCPRIVKRKLNIDPESLVPRLPKASDLKPYPSVQCIEYITPYSGDEVPVIRSISPSPDGRFLASGASDGFLRIWEVETGRLLRSWDLSSLSTTSDSDQAIKPVVCVEWNPNRLHHCLIAAAGNTVFVVATGTANADDALLTDALLEAAKKGGKVTSEAARKSVSWATSLQHASKVSVISCMDNNIGVVASLTMTKDVACIRWQAKGDYFVSVCPKAGAAAVLIHQLSKANSQQPFKKAKGEAQVAAFHPSKPFLFVASQQHVRIYHLVKQTMVKRLISGSKWISSLDIHPSGDHLIVGSLDRRMLWFDLDLSATPYRTLKYHERAIRASCYHGRYPLMASASDDGTVHVFHSMVYSDLMKNPLIVPVKILKGHSTTNKLGVLSARFHPTQPWLFSCGADGKIILYQDI